MSEEVMFCPKHPDVEANLSCIRCGRVMCIKCVKATSVGYICAECARRHDDKFFDNQVIDYPIVFVTSALGNAIACVLAISFGWWIGFFIGGAAGGLVGTLARRLTGKRVGRYSSRIAIAAAVLGIFLSPILSNILSPIQTMMFGGNWLDITSIVTTIGFVTAIYSIYERKI
jgi:uncharacterized membrane protein YjjP (DUF1212 family)